MLLNHERKTVGGWDDARPSLCPDCRAPLLARRGRVVVWHWAHKPRLPGVGGEGCPSEETAWHLAWKAVYHRFPGWEVEVPYILDGKLYCLDALQLQRPLSGAVIFANGPGRGGENREVGERGFWLRDRGEQFVQVFLAFSCSFGIFFASWMEEQGRSSRELLQD